MIDAITEFRRRFWTWNPRLVGSLACLAFPRIRRARRCVRTAKCFTVILCCGGSVWANPPEVRSSVPDADATGVDSKIREIRVTYDQPMDAEHGYSILSGGVTEPRILGRPRWDGDRTLVLRVQLEPDHRYVLVYNNQSNANNIRNKQDEPAVPYVLSFITAPLPGHKEVGSPHVVKSSPGNNDQNVDPATHELRITFDQTMDTEGMSLVGGGPEFPEITGKPGWTDGNHTIIFAMKLEPDHSYRMSVNNARFTGFANQRGISAVPYPIHFKTAKAGSSSRPESGTTGQAAEKTALPATEANRLTPEQNRESIDILRQAIDEDYSYRDLRHVDWPKQFERFTPEMTAAATPLEFARLVARLLEPANDLHLSVEADGQVLYPWNGKVPPANFNLDLLKRIVPGWAEHGHLVATGAFPSGPTYVLIRLWDDDHARDLDAAYEAVRSADANHGLIIDVRPNGGGDEPTAGRFAGCFVDTPRVYGKNENRFGGKFHGPYDRALEPNTSGPRYRGKVVVLMGPRCVSSNESFLLMMKTVPGCKLIGARSRGASGNPKPVRLANDVVVNLSSWRDMLPDGTCFEGIGIGADVEVKTTPADFAQRDPVLEAGLGALGQE